MRRFRLLAFAQLVRGQDDRWLPWSTTSMTDGNPGGGDSPSRIGSTCFSCQEDIPSAKRETQIAGWAEWRDGFELDTVIDIPTCCKYCGNRDDCVVWEILHKPAAPTDSGQEKWVCSSWTNTSGTKVLDLDVDSVWSDSCQAVTTATTTTTATIPHPPGPTPTKTTTTTTTSAVPDYDTYNDSNAYEAGDHGAIDIDTDQNATTDMLLDDCRKFLLDLSVGDCVVFRQFNGTCWRRRTCNHTKFDTLGTGVDTYVKKAVPITTGPPTQSTTTTDGPKKQGSGVWIPLLASLGAVIIVAACVGGFWYGRRKPTQAREQQEPLFDHRTDPEVCLPQPRVDTASSGSEAKVGTTGTPTPAGGSEAPKSRDNSQPGFEPEIQLAREAGSDAPKPELQPALSSQSTAMPSKECSSQPERSFPGSGSGKKAGITVRVDDEMIYFRVPGAATATVAGEWAWPGTSLWHVMTAAPKHVDGLWELGPMQQQLSPDFRVTVDGSMLQTSTHEALAERQ